MVQCVGYNYYGQLGQSSPDAFGTPVLLNFPSSISAKPKKVITGYDHTCTLFYDGHVWCNGSNGFGQLGNGLSGVNSATPVQVKKGPNVLTNVIDIEAGAYHNCAIQNTGAMYCWGFDEKGQLGMNSIMDGSTNEKKAVKMALSLSSTCVITGTETNPSKSTTCVGKGFSSDNSDSTTIDLVNDVDKLTAGSHHFCALLVGDTAKCWGANNAGQLGIGSTDLNPRYNSAEDVRASPGTSILSSIADINAGHLSTCLVLVNGTPMCFGNNRFYQLGIANGGANVLYPTNVSTAIVSGKTLVSLHVGENTSHAVFNDGSIYSMGTNNGGTLGDGSTVSSRNVVGDVSGAIAPQMGYDDIEYQLLDPATYGGVCPNGYEVLESECLNAALATASKAGYTSVRPALSVEKWTAKPCGCQLYDFTPIPSIQYEVTIDYNQKLSSCGSFTDTNVLGLVCRKHSRQYLHGQIMGNSCPVGTVKIETIQDCFSAGAIADEFVTSSSDGSNCIQSNGRTDRPSGCYVNVDVNQVCFNTVSASTVIPSNFPSWAAPLCKVRRYLHGQIMVNSCPAGTVKVETIQDCFSAEAVTDGFIDMSTDQSGCSAGTGGTTDRPSGCYVDVITDKVCFNEANADTVDSSSFPTWAASLCKVT